MLVNCVAYQDGRRLGEIRPDEIRRYLAMPGCFVWVAMLERDPAVLEEMRRHPEIGYDARLARFSPGAVLLFLLVEDLTLHRRPRVVNFGIGDAHYKREFGTVELSDASIFLLRRTVANRLRVAVHRGLIALRTRAKGALE